MKKLLPHTAPPELPSQWRWNMKWFAGCALIVTPAWCLACVYAPPALAFAAFGFLFAIFPLAITRLAHVGNCPECQRPMRFERQIFIVNEQSHFGRYWYWPWTVLRCASCHGAWRVGATCSSGSNWIGEEEMAVLRAAQSSASADSSNHPMQWTRDEAVRRG